MQILVSDSAIADVRQPCGSCIHTVSVLAPQLQERTCACLAASGSTLPGWCGLRSWAPVVCRSLPGKRQQPAKAKLLAGACRPHSAQSFQIYCRERRKILRQCCFLKRFSLFFIGFSSFGSCSPFKFSAWFYSLYLRSCYL